jgi:CRP-like cAMP-binding protein
MEWRLFDGVPEAEVRAVLSLARRRVFRRGEVVFHRGDPADSVHLIG